MVSGHMLMSHYTGVVRKDAIVLAMEASEHYEPNQI